MYVCRDLLIIPTTLYSFCPTCVPYRVCVCVCVCMCVCVCVCVCFTCISCPPTNTYTCQYACMYSAMDIQSIVFLLHCRILRLLDQLMEVTDTEVFHLSLWTVVRDSHNYRFQALLYITHRLKGASSEQVVTASSKQTVVRPIVWEGDKRNVPVRSCLYIHPCLYEHMCVWGGGSACVYVHIYVYACVSHMCIDVAKAWKHGTVPLLLPGHFIFVVY